MSYGQRNVSVSQCQVALIQVSHFSSLHSNAYCFLHFVADSCGMFLRFVSTIITIDCTIRVIRAVHQLLATPFGSITINSSKLILHQNWFIYLTQNVSCPDVCAFFQPMYVLVSSCFVSLSYFQVLLDANLLILNY